MPGIGEEYASVRGKLDEAGYRETLPLEALSLADHLLRDLTATTESLNKTLKHYGHYKELAQELEVGVGPFKEENVRLVKENSCLRMEVLKLKEEYEERLRESDSRKSDLEAENSNLKQLLSRFGERVKNLEVESVLKSNKIGQLQKRNLESVLVMPEGCKKQMVTHRQRMEISSFVPNPCPFCVRVKNYVDFGKNRDPKAIDFLKLTECRIEALHLQIRTLKASETDMASMVSCMKTKVTERDEEIDKLRRQVSVKPGGVAGLINGNSKIGSKSDNNLHIQLKAAEMQLEMLQRRNINLEKKLKSSILQEHQDFMLGRMKSTYLPEREQLLREFIELDVDKYPTHDEMNLHDKLKYLEMQLSNCCKQKAELRAALLECQSKHRRQPSSDCIKSTLKPGTGSSLINGTSKKSSDKSIPGQSRRNYEMGQLPRQHSSRDPSQELERELLRLKVALDSLHKDKDEMRAEIDRKDEKMARMRQDCENHLAELSRLGIAPKNAELQNDHSGDQAKDNDRERSHTRRQIETLKKELELVSKEREEAARECRKKGLSTVLDLVAKERKEAVREHRKIGGPMSKEKIHKRGLSTELDKANRNEKSGIGMVVLQRENFEMDKLLQQHTSREQELERELLGLQVTLNYLDKNEMRGEPDRKDGKMVRMGQDCENHLAELSRQGIAPKNAKLQNDHSGDQAEDNDRERSHTRRQVETLKKELELVSKEREEAARECRKRGLSTELGLVGKERKEGVREHRKMGEAISKKGIHKRGLSTELDKANRNEKSGIGMFLPQTENYEMVQLLRQHTSREQELERELLGLKVTLDSLDKDKDKMRGEPDRKDEKMGRMGQDCENHLEKPSRQGIAPKNAKLQNDHSGDQAEDNERERSHTRRQIETLKKELELISKEREEAARECRKRGLSTELDKANRNEKSGIGMFLPQRENYEMGQLLRQHTSREQELERELLGLKVTLDSLDKDKDEMRADPDRNDGKMNRRGQDRENHLAKLSRLGIAPRNADLQIDHSGDQADDNERELGHARRQIETKKKELDFVGKERKEAIREHRKIGEAISKEEIHKSGLSTELDNANRNEGSRIGMFLPQRENYEIGQLLRQHSSREQELERELVGLKVTVDLLHKDKDEMRTALDRKDEKMAHKGQDRENHLAELSRLGIASRNEELQNDDSGDQAEDNERELGHARRQIETLKKELDLVGKEREEAIRECRKMAGAISREEIYKRDLSTDLDKANRNEKSGIGMFLPQRENYEMGQILRQQSSREQELERELLGLKVTLDSLHKDKDEMGAELDRKDEKRVPMGQDRENHLAELSRLGIAPRNADLQIDHSGDQAKDNERELGHTRIQIETHTNELDFVGKERKEAVREHRIIGGAMSREEIYKRGLSTEQDKANRNEKSGIGIFLPQRENYEMGQLLRQQSSREQELERELLRLKVALDSLDKDKDEMRAELDRKDEKMAHMGQDCKNHLAELSRQGLALKNAELQIDHSGDQAKDNERELGHTRRQIETLKKELDLVGKEREEAVRECRKMAGAMSKDEYLKRGLSTELDKANRNEKSGIGMFLPQRENYEMGQLLRQHASREQELERELLRLKVALDSLDKDKDEMRAELDRKDEKMARMGQDCEKHLAELSRQGLALKNAELQIDHSGDQAKDNERELGHARRQIETLKKELDLVGKEREEAVRECRKMAGAMSKEEIHKKGLSTELDKANRISDDLRKQLQKYIEEVRQMEFLLQQKEEEMETWIEHYRNLSVERNTLESQRTTLEREATSIRDGVREAVDNNITLSNQLTAQNQLVRSYEQEIERLSLEVVTLENQLSSSNQKERTIETDIKAAQDLSFTLQTKMDKLRLELANAESAKNKLEAETEEQKRHIDLLEDQLKLEIEKQKKLEELITGVREKEFSDVRKAQEVATERDRLSERLKTLQNRTEFLNDDVSKFRMRSTELQNELDRTKRQLQSEKAERETALTELRRVQEQLNSSSTNRLLGVSGMGQSPEQSSGSAGLASGGNQSDIQLSPMSEPFLDSPYATSTSRAPETEASNQQSRAQTQRSFDGK